MSTQTGDFLNRRDVIDRLNREFGRFDPSYAAHKRRFGAALRALVGRMQAIQENERKPLYRSQQIAEEATWYLHYTCDWRRLAERLEALRASLSGTATDAADQVALTARPDGSFGAGGTLFFQTLDTTTDAVQREDYKPAPLHFLAPFLTPPRMIATLEALQTSDIARFGVNNRGEIASLESSLLQFLTKRKLRAMLADPALWEPGLGAVEIGRRIDALKADFDTFIDSHQNPYTGFWGPWYILEGTFVQMHDLSFTFHIVNVRKGQVQHWPAIIATTLEIGRLGLDYPYGWKPSDSPSPYSNHHNTDVVTLFGHGLDAAEPAQKIAIADAVETMLDWCLMTSLERDAAGEITGRFVPVDETSVAERYGFGFGFLDLVGFWESGPAIWRDPPRPRRPAWPDRIDVARRMLAAIEALAMENPYFDNIFAKLRPLVGQSPHSETTPVA